MVCGIPTGQISPHQLLEPGWLLQRYGANTNAHYDTYPQ